MVRILYKPSQDKPCRACGYRPVITVDEFFCKACTFDREIWLSLNRVEHEYKAVHDASLQQLPTSKTCQCGIHFQGVGQLCYGCSTEKQEIAIASEYVPDLPSEEKANRLLDLKDERPDEYEKLLARIQHSRKEYRFWYSRSFPDN